jgi:predicted RNA-binding Zn ribbon-like protein
MNPNPSEKFPSLGGPLALDLNNTVIGAPGAAVDLLGGPADLEAWLRAEGERLPQPGRKLREADVVAVRAIREPVSAAIDQVRHGRRPSPATLRALTAAQRAAPEYRELGWDGNAVIAHTRRSGEYTARLVAELALAATDLLTSPAVTNVRQCERADCRMLFVPAHPHRRWCSTTCGNRARVARYYERHKLR